MRPDALLHVNVPSASSLQPPAGKAMGLIGTLGQMTNGTC